ncbi:MAG: hypothetical protein KBS66_00420 [Eubacterium sp.]|nr:hypothetical protein [Candidatus Colimonas fimequi]
MQNTHNGENGYGITFDIIEHIGVLATFPTGWRREINLVSWNGAAGKYDIRDSDPSHSSMSKGLTFKENEMRLLLDLMRRRSRGYGQRRGAGAEAHMGQQIQEEIQVAEPEAAGGSLADEGAGENTECEGVPVEELDGELCMNEAEGF